ncbi:MAG TPA: bifunctional helix-turn-helix transcriptional regulator/GNAT family N-acetyltransferase, partial [Bryobacteraceae bacterium]|nr:bifunctional helix-turn-helix transcriptional regulator/GNAT family N-acetyltransferase [Bryobacteraceae bacterium]
MSGDPSCDPSGGPLVTAVRAFNRFYTRRIGVLDEGHLKSPYSLAEVRVLYELAHRDRPLASELARDLGLDAGYLSRMLRGFQGRGLLARAPSRDDARQSRLALTAKGKRTFAPLENRASEAVAGMLHPLTDGQRASLAGAMDTIRRLLEPRGASEAPYTLRPHRPGDMGWVIHRHAVLYAREYGWDERFEALVAEIAARFIQNFDPRRERCWIAERAGEPLGSVFLVKESDEAARLRLLLVEPAARGLGLGSRLVEECVAFARQA